MNYYRESKPNAAELSTNSQELGKKLVQLFTIKRVIKNIEYKNRTAVEITEDTTNTGSILLLRQQYYLIFYAIYLQVYILKNIYCKYNF